MTANTPDPSQQFGHPSTWPQAHQPPQAYPPPAPAPRGKRGLSPLRVVLLVLSVAVVLAGAGIAAAAVSGKGPAAGLVKDSGVKACEQIRDNAAAEKASPAPSPTASKNAAESLKAYQAFRKQLADSRYDDLRIAGTEVIDLIYQMSGSGNSDADAGVALAAMGQLVQKWASFAGACQNHGVTIPKLGEVSSN